MEIVGIVPLILGFAGFTIGTIIVLTMPAPAMQRFIADTLVFLTAVIGVGLVIVGVLRTIAGLSGALLIPVLTSIALRLAWPKRS
jgi:hypothetical protein